MISSSQEITEIKRKLWNGSVNIKVIYQYGNDHNQRIDYLLNCYRNSYFPIYYQQLIKYINHYGQDLLQLPIWFEYEGVPIKWNLPIGVLYDYLHLPGIDRNNNLENDGVWELHLKTSKFPTEYIIPFIYTNPDLTINYERSLSEVIMNQLKESCFVINGNAKPIMNLSEDNSRSLLASILTHNFGQFTTMSKKIVSKTKFDRIPLKIYIAGSLSVIQAPIDAAVEGKSVSLRDVLDDQLPKLFGTSKIARPYIHGIDASAIMGLPLQDIWHLFKHLDNFLYVVVLVSK